MYCSPWSCLSNQAGGNLGRQWPKVLPDILVDGLQGLETCSGAGSVDIDHVAHTVIDGHEYRRAS